MKLTPLDILKQEFKSAVKGFDKKEVKSFLDIVRSEFEFLLRENSVLRDELKQSMKKLDDFKEKEKLLQETLISSREISNDLIEKARKESEIIVAEAELKAHQIIEKAHNRVANISGEINELKRQRNDFIVKFKQLLEYYESSLNIEKEEDDNITYFSSND